MLYIGGIFKRTLLALLAMVGLLAACGERSNDYPRVNPPPDLLEDVRQQNAGQILFQKHCATCHGRSEEGRSSRVSSYVPPPPDFLARSYRKADPAYLFWRISVGKTVEPYRSRGSIMPSYAPHLSEEEIWQLVAYLRSRSVVYSQTD